MIALFGGADVAQAGPVRCPDVDVVVEQQLNGDLAVICRGARRAITFLAEQGAPQRAPVRIDVVSVLPTGHPEAVGCFDAAAGKAYVVGRDACVGDGKRMSAFLVPFDARVYESYVAHEVAHAIAAQNFEVAAPSRTSHEYIAAVVQLGAMDGVLRDEILSVMPGQGFDRDMEINLFGYQVDPGYFAAQSYRHFQMPGNGAGYFTKLFSGQVLLPDYEPY
ncbi:DUF6639 family protein [Aliisedimentitalea sp. MJ-SS2]|uniref:DUF6639 family protein n=1 Tax=Aliisedimentitalea sp. MJ-SS2 TaxID=3049795 RepID=UPI002930ABA8|nr:DUF6639 family protein [Alisedimentitalea sp. MJ-SS2]